MINIYKTNHMNTKNNPTENNARLIILVVIFLMLCLWLIPFWYVIYIYKVSENNEAITPGAFGDMFGGIDALFSGLAFAGLLVTLFFQCKDLKLQRFELKLTRKEFKRQIKEIREQNTTMKLQRFENTLFNLLQAQREIAKSLPTINHNGLECSHFKGMYRKYYASSDEIVEFYNNQYFTHLYFILTFIDKSLNTEKGYYVSILYSQLNEYELFAVYFHVLQYAVDEEIKAKIEKYSFFRNLNSKLIKNFSQHHPYHQGAYGYKACD